ncbi:MAG: alpha-hydroxy-acid oxidizing protein [Alphaproteobacteria bacterium]|nr:alpha-hydroxy-acid oxidizing protein [Alphaproteobacteria bacterium]MBV9377715.1 alpha-hydroxy-acid oxidizing protein [Alphaproteobacteria bacterium]
MLGASPQRQFYAGTNLDHAVTVEDLRAMAHRRLPGFVLEYLEAGGEDEATLARNIAALAEWRFLHRSLVDVSRRDVSTVLFGRKLTIPVIIAPTGLNELFWPHADLRLAEAAAEFGIPFTQSTMSNDAMSRVARVPGLRYWWQLYVFGPPNVRETLINRARDSGCEALVVTVDAQIYGNREWHKRTTAGPTSLSWSSQFDALLHPRWFARGILTHGMPRFENVVEFVPKHRRGFFDSAHWIRSQMDRALSWDTIARIRERWPRKLVIKGLLDVEDIARAAEIGADAVAISNHGGRQLDWAVAPLDLLPAARQAVGDRIAILVDGGFRRGTDVIKALALGADAVLVGRATLYGVAAAGKDGAKRALDILREEIMRDFGLLEVRSAAELGPRLLVRANPWLRHATGITAPA